MDVIVGPHNETSVGAADGLVRPGTCFSSRNCTHKFVRGNLSLKFQKSGRRIRFFEEYST